MDYDYALLELQEPVTITKDVNVIKVVEKGVELESGTMCTITGWGSPGVSSATNFREYQCINLQIYGYVVI